MQRTLLNRLLSTIQFIHMLRYVHTDLKPENLGIKMKDDKIVNIEIIDIGAMLSHGSTDH